MTIWQIPNGFPNLEKDRIHIWRANLDLSPQQIECLESFLSEDEIVRANKFRFARHHRRFVVARGILRKLLGSYLNINPKNLVFTYGNKGKPFLNRVAECPLQFNLSHSHEYALFGFTFKHLIGVDLEYQRPMPDALKIARRFFSQQEFQMIEEVEAERRLQLFFQLWTAKEAYLKALGIGLTDSLASVEIAIDRSDNSFYLSALEQDAEVSSKWSLYTCVPAENYTAAIAVNAPLKHNVDYWHW